MTQIKLHKSSKSTKYRYIWVPVKNKQNVIKFHINKKCRTKTKKTKKTRGQFKWIPKLRQQSIIINNIIISINDNNNDQKLDQFQDLTRNPNQEQCQGPNNDRAKELDQHLHLDSQQNLQQNLNKDPNQDLNQYFPSTDITKNDNEYEPDYDFCPDELEESEHFSDELIEYEYESESDSDYDFC